MKKDKVYYLIPALNVVKENNAEFKYVCDFDITKHLIKENINDIESGIDYIDLYTGLYWEGDERDIFREILIVPTFIAKNNNTHEFLVNKMKNKEITKKYLAIVKGVIEQDNFEINKPIGRNPNQPHKMAVTENGKESISIVKVLRRFSDATLIEVQLITGRTHQIRVHLMSIGHPVYNDTLYGFGKMKIKTQEQVLQSYKLSFPRPYDGKVIEIEIPQDEKINKVLSALS